MYARGPPQWVFLVHPPNELAQLTANSGPAWSAVRFPAPIGPKPRSMPPQDRVRLQNAQGQTGAAGPEQDHPHQYRPVIRTEPQAVRCPPQGNIELMSKKKVLD